MVEYLIKISGVHYGANGDSVALQKDTEESHVRTRELLSQIDRERPFVTLAPDPVNHIHQDAVMARALSRRIGRVAKEYVDLVWALLRQSGKGRLLARVKEVVVKNHGYVMVTVSADELGEVKPAAATEIEWRPWMSDVPLLPPSEMLQTEEDAAFVLDNVFMPCLADCDVNDLKRYLDAWIEGSWHDLSYEAQEKRSQYICQLQAVDDKNIRQLAEPLMEQRSKICEREMLDEHATTWWQERLKSQDVQRLWQQWRLKNDNKLWLGLRRIDALLRDLPGAMYDDIGQLDVVLSRLYYLNTPRRAFQGILALLMLRELTCRELGIVMRPMTDEDYGQDGLITNRLKIPTTIERVVAFGETQCDSHEKHTIERLVYWLRDDYEQSHCAEIESLAEDPQVRLANAIEKAADKKTNEFKVYPQSGSTTNMGCDQKNSDFKTYLPGADGTGQQSMLESRSATERE